MPIIFPLSPISRGTFALFLIAAAAFIIPAAALWFSPDVQWGMAGALTVLLLGLASLFAWFAVMQRRSTVVITERDITLNVPIYGRTIARDRLILDSLGKATTKTLGPYRLKLRTNGVSMPGYQLGWFRTHGAGRILASISNNELVVWQTHDNYGVVVSVQDSDGLIAALRNGPARVDR